MKMLLIPTMILMMSQAYAQDCLERICKGDTIIDRDSDVGQVVGILEGKVVYRVGSNRYEASIQGMGKEIASTTFPVGKIVIDKDSDIGTVVNAFDDSRVKYRVGSNNYVSNTLSPEVENLGALRANTVVIDKDSDIGVVGRTFANSKVQYKIGSNNYVSMASNLSHEVSSVGPIKPGIIVIDKDSDIGTAKRIFNNTKVQYQIGSSNYISMAANLSAETSNVDHLAKGVIVLDRDSDVGVVQRLFENKKIQYKLGSSNYISMSENLSPEVPSHEKYNKEDLYAAGTSVGHVEYFFENGKNSLKTLDNYRTISKDLAAEVQSLGNASVGSKLETSSKEKVSALNLFENGTILVEKNILLDGKELKISKGVQLINLSEMSALVSSSYLLQLYLANNNASGPSIGGNLAVLEQDLPDLKVKLASDLVKTEKSFGDKKLLKELKKYLGAVDLTPEEEAPRNETTPTPAPTGDTSVVKTNLQLKINDESLLPIAMAELAKKGIYPEVVKELNSTNALEIAVKRSKGFPLPKCSISFSHTRRTANTFMTQSGAQTKRVFASYKNSCNRPLKKVIKSLEFIMN